VQLQSAMKILGVDLDTTESFYLLKLIDTDGDQSISFEEFAAYVLAYQDD
jgi:Ca2+-binding EF-hand superfamily protein